MANDWTLTRDRIISRAFKLIGVLPNGGTLSDLPDNVSDARDSLLLVLSDLENEHNVPFRIKRLQYPLSKASDEVTLNSVIYTCIRQHKSVNAITWTMSTAKSVGDKVYPTVENGFYYEVVKLTISGTSGNTSLSEPTFPDRQGVTVTDNEVVWEAKADNKPGVGKDWESYWVVRGSTGGSWAVNTDFYTIGEFDLPSGVEDVLNVYFREDKDDLKLPLISRDKYNQIYDKGDDGEPYCVFFDKYMRNDVNSRATYRLVVYPQSDNTNRVIHYDALMSMNDVDVGTDTLQSTFNLPNRWITCIEYGLAYRLGEEFQISSSKLARLEKKYQENKAIAKGRDNMGTGARFICGTYNYERNYYGY